MTSISEGGGGGRGEERGGWPGVSEEDDSPVDTRLVGFLNIGQSNISQTCHTLHPLFVLAPLLLHTPRTEADSWT